jgi:hypothetical protein
MRFSLAVSCLAIASLVSSPRASCAQESPYAHERAAARRELQLAKIDFRNYWQIEYPRFRRQLDAQIELTEGEIKIYKERSTGSAVSWELQNLRMCLREAELRLRDLWAERNNLIRFRTPEWRELELRVQDARLRVAEIEAAIEKQAGAGEMPAG